MKLSEAGSNLFGQPSAGSCFGLQGCRVLEKTTIAEALQMKLLEQNFTAVLLDGDSVRCGLSKDLGFSDEDRAENTRRVAEVSKLVTDAGLSVIVAMISPFQLETPYGEMHAEKCNFY